jgi:beta-lactamase regulating signal transducer with metallopeptidase domain
MGTLEKAVWIAKDGGLPECLNALPAGATLSAPPFEELSMIAGNPDWTRALAWALVHSLWLGLFAVVFHAGASRCLSSARVRLRYAVTFGALLAVPVAVAWTLAYEFFMLVPPTLQLRAAGEPLDFAALRPHAPSAWDAARAWCATWLTPLEPWVAALWIAGAALLAARLCGAWIWSRQRRANEMKPAAATWQVHIARLGRRSGLTRRVRLYTSRLIDVPMVIGRMAPRVVVPARALVEMPIEELDALLLHELAHVRRGDGWFALVQGVVEALFFYHPAVWWLSARVRSEREHCCDEAALAASCDRRSLARALFTLETCRGVNPHRLAPLALAASDGSLLARIQRIAGVGDRRARGEQRVMWSAAAGVGLLGVAAGAIPAHAPWRELRVHIAVDAMREATNGSNALAAVYGVQMALFGQSGKTSPIAALPKEFERKLVFTSRPLGADGEGVSLTSDPGQFITAESDLLINLVEGDVANVHGSDVKRHVFVFKTDRHAPLDDADESGPSHATGIWTTSPASIASKR